MLIRLCAAVAILLAAGGTAPEPRIYFSAVDKQEKPVLGLTAADFELRIDGKIVPMTGFRAGKSPTDRSVPLVAWVLIDFNPNIDQKVIRRQADAAAQVFEMLHPASALGVKLVSDRSETLAPLAHDPGAVRAAFVGFGERRSELKAGTAAGTEVVGKGGIARAAELAIEEIDVYIASQPSLSDREVHRAIMILSDGNINPSFNLKPLYVAAARSGVSLYPVFVPRTQYGIWVGDYFDLAKKTSGVGSVFGALKPGSEILPLPRSDLGPNALNVNFIHMVRDVNGKYSFLMPATAERLPLKIRLKCKVKDVRILLPWGADHHA